MASHAPSKRKPGPQSTAAARKRAKTYDARSLAVQSADAALSASGELDVAAYVGAREFEIRALESGMQRSRSALTSRAFQSVPRSLRRRTASHNVKRVPQRLRARAKREMVEDNTPTVTARRRKPTQSMRIRLETARRLQNLNAKTKAKRAVSRKTQEKETKQPLEDAGSHSYTIAPRVPKIKKNKLSRPPPPESRYKKRQRNKTWLPTHMFHAKRAYMASCRSPLWRFALPLSPTEKSYRPSHRASTARGAVAWDMSYMSTIQLEGTGSALETVLRAIGVDGDDAWGVKGRKWRNGTRCLQAWAFEKENPRRLIAPVTLIWCGEARSKDVDMGGTGRSSRPEKRNRRKMWMRIHPSVFLQLWTELLELSKRQNPPVMVEDLRFDIGSIEITGPGSTEALISTLQPFMAEGQTPPADSPEATWSSLLGVSNPGSLPLNALLAFSISDPRLHSPLKTLKPPSDETHLNNLAMLLSSWPPDHTQQASALFNRPSRLNAARQLPSQKAINRRRTSTAPGTYPSLLPSDPHIPIIALTTRPGTKNDNSLGSWTVLMPWKCVLPIWQCLMYYPLSSGGNARFGGLKETQQLAFEAGEPWFPGDFPGTRAGWEWNLREREQAKNEWERRPKGRRIEFDSLDLGNGRKGEVGRGWTCDWERLVQGPPKDAEKASGKETNDNDGEVQEEDAIVHPPLNIRQLRKSDAEAALSSPLTTDTPFLATVRISVLGRGTPTPRARIYRLPSNVELRKKWCDLASPGNPNQPGQDLSQIKAQHYPSEASTPTTSQEKPRRDLAASLIVPPTAETSSQHLALPPEEDLIGFVTTGNYNLSEGRGTGIGSILMSRVAVKGEKRQGRLCIIRAAGERVGRLGRWEIV